MQLVSILRKAGAGALSGMWIKRRSRKRKGKEALLAQLGVSSNAYGNARGCNGMCAMHRLAVVWVWNVTTLDWLDNHAWLVCQPAEDLIGNAMRSSRAWQNPMRHMDVGTFKVH